jgi:hypothetical protein
MMNVRRSFTRAATVSAAENIVNWLKAELEGEKQPDRVEKVERHIGQFNTPDRSKAICPGAAAVSVLRPWVRNHPEPSRHDRTCDLGLPS